MKVAILTTDNRENFHEYDKTAPYFGTAPEALLQGFPKHPEVEIHVVSCMRKPMPCPARLAPNIYFHGVLVNRWGWLRSAYLGCIRGVRKKLQEIKPDIVHGQGTERDCAMSAVYSGYPNVVTIHGNMAALFRQGLIHNKIYGLIAARLENIAIRRTNGVFCNSRYTESLIKPRARRTWLIPNALRERFYSNPVPQASGTNRCVLLNIGSIIPLKRQLELLDLFRELYERGLQFEVHFIGRAEPTQQYASLFVERMREAEKHGYARFSVFKTTEELIEIMDGASGLVHFPAQEAFGLVVAESLARGLKLFGARLGGIQDIASGVPGAELFEANDWKGLGSGIAHWVRAGFPKYPEAGCVMKERYHPVRIAERHLEIYKEVLNARSNEVHRGY